MLTGRLIIESLRTGVDVEVPDLRVLRVGRHDVSASTSPDPGGGGPVGQGATADQPQIWTFLDFEAPDERADQIGQELAGALDPATGWYADFRVADDHVVVFADRVFRYRIGDDAAREEAVAWGRAAGTPEHQLDWGD
jgi:hypothetical protein